MDSSGRMWALILAAAAVLGIVAGAIRNFETIAARIKRILTRRRPQEPQVEISRVSDPEDDDLHEALILYKKRLPEHERDQDDDIIRWFQEIEAETKNGICELKDYFLVARLGDRVCGLMYFHYYPETKLAFVSYLVTDGDNDTTQSRVTNRLAKRAGKLLKKEAKGLIGFVAETDDPRRAESSPKRLEARARIKLFRKIAQTQRAALMVLDMPYVQPRTSLEERDAQATPMVLIYARPGRINKLPFIPKADGERILRFVYNTVYADEFPDSDGRYREHLRGLLEKQLAQLPDQIPTSLDDSESQATADP